MRSLLAVAVAGLLLAGGAAAYADPGSTTRDGRTLTVSKATELRVEGERVRVRGSGYDRNKGIYVAFCVDNGPGKVPTPCGGGADTEGSSGNSVWISDLPPAYGSGLAQPYGEGGSFDVEIFVRALLRSDDPETDEDETVDCRTTRCAVVTRNDHTRSDDRSQDVAVPIAFGAAKPPAPAPSTTAAPEPAAPARAAGQSAAPVDQPASATPTPSTARPSAAASTAPSPEPVAATSALPLAAEDPDVTAATEPASSDGTPAWVPLLVAAAAASAAGAGVLGWRRRVRDGS